MPDDSKEFAAADPSGVREALHLQRLEGQDALLTKEWDLRDINWLELGAGVAALGDAGDAGMPRPPSQRRAGIAAAARPGDAGPLQGPLQRTVTVPKKPRRSAEAAPTVVVALDLGATLPPRTERDLHELAGELPTVERDASVATGDRFAPLSGRRSLVAFGALLVAAIVWTTTSGRLLTSTEEGDASAASRLPDFLREASAAAPSQPLARSGALPPELAATLAQALPATPRAGDGPFGDAGAPSAPPEPPTATAPLPTPADLPVSTETQRRADALRAALEAEAAQGETFTAAAGVPHSGGAGGVKHAPANQAKVVPISIPPASSTPLPSRKALPTSSSSGAVPSGKAPSTSQSLERVAPPASDEARKPREPSHAIRPLTTYAYEPKALFSVATAPMRVTDLVLQPGEKLVSQPTAGDSARWVISVVAPGAQTHVFVKPLRTGLRTNLTLTTDRRSYFLELSSSEGAYMAGVQWTYPSDEAAERRQALAQAERERQSTTAISDLQALRFDYQIQVTAGSPSWKPTMVFDDGQKTFVRFSRPVVPSKAPLLFVLRSGSTKDAKFVNYRIKNDLYVIDRLIDSAELRWATGDDAQDVVRITRKERR